MAVVNPSGSVHFKYGVQDGYDSLPKKSESIFYLALDSQRLFLGDSEYTRPIEVGLEVPTKPGAPNSVYIRKTEKSFELYHTSDGEVWSRITYVPDESPKEIVVSPTPPEDLDVIWIDPTDNDVDGPVHFDTTLTQPGYIAEAYSTGEAIRAVDAKTVTDPTLKEEGRPADALAVGQELDKKQPAGDYIKNSDLADWAKSPTKPEYTHEEVHALSDTTQLKDLKTDDLHRTVRDIDKKKWNAKSDFSGNYKDLIDPPTKVSQFENDSQYLVSETDPTVPEWAKFPVKPEYTYEEVGADPEGTARKRVTLHNEDSLAHSDIRGDLRTLSKRIEAIQAVLESPDESLDELVEIVKYIKDNRDLIQQITDGKVSVEDIVDDLVSAKVVNKPLSANMGFVLKGLIDDLDSNKIGFKQIVQDLNTNDSRKVLSAAVGVSIQKLIDDINAEMPRRKVVVSPTPPKDLTSLWVDTSDDSTNEPQVVDYYFPKGIILLSDNGTPYLINVDNDGKLISEKYSPDPKE